MKLTEWSTKKAKIVVYGKLKLYLNCFLENEQSTHFQLLISPKKISKWDLAQKYVESKMSSVFEQFDIYSARNKVGILNSSVSPGSLKMFYCVKSFYAL